MIENQYEGLTSENLWDEWDFDQRAHFLSDHNYEDRSLVAMDYNELPIEVQNAIEMHREDGQYATGGKLSSFWDATKKHASTAYNKTKHVSKKAYDKTKKAVKDKIHDTKKKIALEVIDATKDKVTDNKYKMTLKGAENLVEDKYAEGGTLESAWKKFINWCNEEI